MDPELRPAQTSTPLIEGGPPCQAAATPDGWNVNVHFGDGDQQHTYVFDVEQAEKFIDTIQSALLYARAAQR